MSRKVNLYEYSIIPNKTNNRINYIVLGFSYEEVEKYLAERVGNYIIEQRCIVKDNIIHMTRNVALLIYENASKAINKDKKTNIKKSKRQYKKSIPKKDIPKKKD